MSQTNAQILVSRQPERTSAVANFDASAEVNVFKDLDHNSNRDAAAAALHAEFCSLAPANKSNTLSELALAGGNTGQPWALVFNGESYLVGLKPPEKDIFVSLKCPT